VAGRKKERMAYAAGLSAMGTAALSAQPPMVAVLFGGTAMFGLLALIFIRK
jgi:hypothetical protein